MINNITLADVEYIAFVLAKELLTLDEPNPDFSCRFPNSLESCLGTPFQTFYRKPLYPGLISKASILFYLMIKNHPFQNGNKRIAVETLLVFLFLNKKWINVHILTFLNFATWIAASPPEFKEEAIKAIEKFLKKYIVRF